MIDIESRVDRIVCCDLPSVVGKCEICPIPICTGIHIPSVLPVPVGASFSLLPSGVRVCVSIYIVRCPRSRTGDPGILLPGSLIASKLERVPVEECPCHRLALRVTENRRNIKRFHRFLVILNNLCQNGISLCRSKCLITHHKTI